MEVQKEGYLAGYPNVFSFDCVKEIVNQMESSVCKIKIDSDFGTCFPCKIPFPTKKELLPILITNNHIINEKALYEKDKKIFIKIGNEKQKIINLNNRRKYTNKDYDITIIELKKSDGINNFLELDDKVIDYIIKNDERNEDYIDETIYIIQYAEGELSVSSGVLKGVYKGDAYDYNFRHNCCTKNGSSGSPILNIKNKIIGIHKECHNNNYNIGSFVNFAIKEFINEIKDEAVLKEFNKKYNIDIKNLYIQKLFIGNKIIGDEGFNHLSKIYFKELKEFRIGSNNITNIKPLLQARFENLEKLYLDNNKIFDISVLEKVKLKGLQELYLSHNYIKNINALEKAQFIKLKKLNLSYNQISNINVLEKVNFKKLKELNLGGNQITDLRVFSKVNFEKLEVLCLGNNNISDINIFKDVKFKELKELFLYENEITDINILEYVDFKKLETLSFGINKIKDIKVLNKVHFEELKVLGFSKNLITDVGVLREINFPKIKKLSLDNNRVDKNDLILSEFLDKDWLVYSDEEEQKKRDRRKKKINVEILN